MAEELHLTPEITMHEEPGEIRINQGSGRVSIGPIEIDDDEPNQSAYDIPAQISITRVNKNLVGGPAKQFLKVRNDLARFPPPGGFVMQGPQHQHHQGARHPLPGGGMPPLIRHGSLPPMPRLRLGSGSRPPMSRMQGGGGPNGNANPLARMFNMMPTNSMMRPPPLPPPRPFVPAPPQYVQQTIPSPTPPQYVQQNIPPPAQSHNALRDVRRQTPITVPNGNNRHNLPAGASVLRPQHRPPIPKQRQMSGHRPMHGPPHHRMSPQAPLPMLPKAALPKPKQHIRNNSGGAIQPKPAPTPSPTPSPTHNVQVPPPLRGNEIASKVIQNGGAYSLFPNLNITVTSRKSPVVQAASPVVTLPDEEDLVEEVIEEEEVVEEDDEEEEEEIDDDEEEELDDVEPVDGATVNGGSSAAAAGLTTTTTSAVTTTVAAAVARKPAGLPAAPPREFQSAPVVVAPSPRRRIETLKFIRTADGKGYTRSRANNLLQKAKATAAGTKKKKRFFRGGNYRFDGKSGKKKKNSLKTRSSAAPSEAGSSDAQLTVKDVPSAVMELEEADVLSYLGIQRKGSEDELENDEVKVRSPTANKAKKSFRPTVSPSAAAISERHLSNDSFCSNDSLTRDLRLIRKRKLENLQNDNHKRAKLAGNGDIQLHQTPTKLMRPLLPLANPNVLEENSKIVERFPSLEEKPLSRTIRTRPKEVRNLSSDLSTKLQTLVCECTKVFQANEASNIATSEEDAPAYECEAIETVGASRIACKNPVTDKQSKRRSSENLNPASFCEEHIQRLKSHQACAFCGEFCAHGAFLMCRPFAKADPHMFHKACFAANGKVCPHCSNADKPLTVLLKLSMDRVPLSLLATVSKMSMVKQEKTKMSDLYKTSDLMLRRTDVVTYKLPNGNIISSEGLPEGLTDESLESVIAAVEDKDKLKHTTRNMYTPTKTGDTVKILQLLSLGYSPIQKFAEAENGTPLHVAASEGHVLTSHILVQAGAELDAIDDEKNTPLMLACDKGRPSIVKYLLASGADLTLRGDDGMTCLHLAAQNGHLDCVHIILTQNALPRKFINLQDEGGWTSLVWACENKHEDVIHYLLDKFADPLITDTEGNIALHWAALSGSHSTCQLLLNRGCNVNAVNSIGESPMHIALRQDHYETALLFLMRRARLDIANKNGQKPFECMPAKNPKCATIVKLTTTLQDLMKDSLKQRLERIICNDLTRGKEINPVQCVNDLDDDNDPEDYVYIKSNVVTKDIPLDRNISTLQHCKCTDNCTTEDTCNCSDLSVKSWYDLDGRLKDGFDYKETPMIFECNDLCRCNVGSCHNRVVQHGISVRLQVFKAYGMGWGVRPLSDVPKGSFVCEYVGELISDSEAETREDSYLFDLDNKDGDTFCIDANNYGNVARFINHSCHPNLTPVKVFASHQDLRFPHIALFANRDIKKGEDLGFDYGEKFWVIKHKFFTCHCASDKCRYSRTNITNFLREYYKRNGEPLPDELTPKIENDVKTTEAQSAKKQCSTKTSANTGKESKAVTNLKKESIETPPPTETKNLRKAAVAASVSSDKKTEKKRNSEAKNSSSNNPFTKSPSKTPELVIPLTKVNVKALANSGSDERTEATNASKAGSKNKALEALEINMNDSHILIDTSGSTPTNRPRRSITKKNEKKDDNSSTK